MKTNFLRLYLELNKTLVKTLVIKSNISANLINEYVREQHGLASVDNYDPSGWKYYQNISGEYHFTDTPMTVTSLDTLEEIPFNTYYLSLHTVTADAYKYGSRYYYSLLNRFPNQEPIINGILNPVDKSKAIEADDFSILGYPSKLVEPQEITLIGELEKYIKLYNVRWNVQAFGLSDNLYHAAQHAVMYLNILPKLLNLRLKRCKTNEAHSFHIREYLASHGKLDRFLPYMTMKQALYFYRNIRYIERNSGKVEQFNVLIEKLLTDRRIPISDFTVRHLDGFNDLYYPNISVRKKPINSEFNTSEQKYISLAGLFNKEELTAYGNHDYIDQYASSIEKTFQNTTSIVTQTKDLESSMVDYTDSVPDPLEVVLLRQWIYMSSQGMYNIVIKFKDPKTSEVRSLFALDAFIYMYYVTLNSIGITVNTIPNVFNLKYRKHPKPTVDYLLSLVDTEYKDFTEIATSLITNQPAITNRYSTSHFFDLTNEIYLESQRHWFIVSNTHDLYSRGYIANMIHGLYNDKLVMLAEPDTAIRPWLHSRNLPEYDYDQDQATTLIRNIFMGSTGATIDNSKLLKNIQKAMLTILTELSSYSIQLLREINESDILPLNWAAIRVGDPKYKHQSQIYCNNRIDVIGVGGSTYVHHNIESDTTKDNLVVGLTSGATYRIETRISTITDYHETRKIDVYFNSFRVSAMYDIYDREISRLSKFIGLEYYQLLSDEQKKQIKSIHS